MRFRILGADKNTGQDIKLILDAVDESAARTKAFDRGILVADVQHIEEPESPLEQLAKSYLRYDAAGKSISPCQIANDSPSRKTSTNPSGKVAASRAPISPPLEHVIYAAASAALFSLLLVFFFAPWFSALVVKIVAVHGYFTQEWAGETAGDGLAPRRW